MFNAVRRSADTPQYGPTIRKLIDNYNGLPHLASQVTNWAFQLGQEIDEVAHKGAQEILESCFDWLNVDERWKGDKGSEVVEILLTNIHLRQALYTLIAKNPQSAFLRHALSKVSDSDYSGELSVKIGSDKHLHIFMNGLGLAIEKFSNNHWIMGDAELHDFLDVVCASEQTFATTVYLITGALRAAHPSEVANSHLSRLLSEMFAYVHDRQHRWVFCNSNMCR